MLKRLTPLIAVLALTACGKQDAAHQAQAGGEVLPGSASDAMLPLDTVTSQPPLAPKAVDNGAKGKAAASEAPADAQPGDAAPAEAAPQG